MEALRRGVFGDFLFYAYLVAILFGAVVLLQFAATDARQNAKITKDAERSCRAIKGAGAYWVEVREAERLKLSDEGASLIERAATARLVAALDHVILRLHQLECDGDGG